MAQRLSDFTELEHPADVSLQPQKDLAEQLREGAARERQMEKTTKWWMACAHEWKDKWSQAHREKETFKKLLANAEKELEEIAENVKDIWGYSYHMTHPPMKVELLKLYTRVNSRCKTKGEPVAKSIHSSGNIRDSIAAQDDNMICHLELMEIEKESQNISETTKDDDSTQKKSKAFNESLNAENATLRSTVDNLCQELIAAQDEIDRVSKQIEDLNRRNKELLDLRDSHMNTLRGLTPRFRDCVRTLSDSNAETNNNNTTATKNLQHVSGVN